MTKVSTEMVGNSLPSKLFYRFCRFLCLVILRTWNRMRVEGRGNLPTSGPYIVAPVHRSNLDTPIAGVAVTSRMRYLAKDSLWKNGALGWLVSSLGGFPVARGTADREALKRCIEVLEAGEPLVMFPEGARQAGTELTPLFDGAAYVATKTGAPIVPIGIGGSERIMPKGSKFIHPRKVHVVIGRPIPVPQAEGRFNRAAVKDMTEQLRVELQRAFDEAQRKAG